MVGVLCVCAVLAGGGGSYARPGALARGRILAGQPGPWLGRAIHLHVSVRVFLRPPHELRRRRYDVYQLRRLQILCARRNPYYRQFLRKRRRRLRAVCLKGRLLQGKHGETVLLVHRVRGFSRRRL